MRKIVAGLFISLDGVTESPQDWNGPFFNDEMGKAVGDAMASSDTLLLGRRTFEEFAAYWPTARSERPVRRASSTTRRRWSCPTRSARSTGSRPR